MKRRHPHETPRFLETSHECWGAIFTGIGLFVLLATSLGWVRDTGVFLQYFTGIGVTFILGASGAEVMRTYKCETISQAESETVSVVKTVHAPKHYDESEIQ
jgi:hypothetical protein